MRRVKAFLNGTTMYRLTLYILIAYVVVASALGFLGILSFSPVDIILQASYLVLISYLANFLLAKLFDAVPNVESPAITALILSLIVGPVDLLVNIRFLTILAIVAMATKYLLAVRKRHIFNPAAAAVVVVTLFGMQGASWWIGTRPMFIPLFIGGVLILAKIKRFTLVLSFLIPYLVYIGLMGVNPLSVFLQSLIVFFASIMLIEPLTSPDKTRMQIAYAGLTAGLFIFYQEFLHVPYTLELALVSGNLFTYFATRPFRVDMVLEKKEKIARETYSFFFKPEEPFDFTPGQFMHWTLPHKKPDSRGFRRYFTISSSPTEDRVMIAVKIPKDHSSFKGALKTLKKGEKIEAMDLSGEFVLPEDKSIPLCFIAGGIGVTPFRSMAKWLVDKGEKRDIVLLYSNSEKEKVCFEKLFDEAEKLGMKTHYVITKKDGYIDEKMIKEKVSNWQEREYYISGPQPMVEIFEKILGDMKVRDIKSDFFPGYTETHQE